MRRLLLAVLLACSVILQAQKDQYPLAYMERKAASPQAPVVILLHGYGSNEADLFSLEKALDPRFHVYSLRAPLATGNGGYCWTRLQILSDHTMRYDYREAEAARRLVEDFIAKVITANRIKPGGIYIAGFSQGAIMCFDMALKSQLRLGGYAPLSGRIIPESREGGKLQKDAIFFIAHGRSDNVILFTEGEKAAAFVKAVCATCVSFHAYDAPHTITRQEMSDLSKWLNGLAFAPSR